MAASERTDDLITASGLPRHEAERLLAVVTGASRGELPRSALSSADRSAFETLAAQRRSGVPLQHLEGTVDFGPLTLLTDGRALVPRPETEQLWELALAVVERPSVVVDMCTGSGNLALALKHAWPDALVVGSDLSPDAVALARENAQATGLDVGFVTGDLFDSLPPELCGAVDLLIANPPYVSEGAFEALPVDVRGHDPYEALVAGPGGTETIARIAEEGPAWLAAGGVMALEIGEDQATATQELCAPLEAEIRKDLAGRDRFAIVRSDRR